jgi:hypothetical protein
MPPRKLERGAAEFDQDLFPAYRDIGDDVEDETALLGHRRSTPENTQSQRIDLPRAREAL